MPKLRFRLLRLMTMPALASVGMSLWIVYAPAVPFNGDQDVGLDVEVHDAASGNPISGAPHPDRRSLFLLEPEKDFPGHTHADGRARIVHRFEVVGELRAYRFAGKVDYEERWLEISAPGYTDIVAAAGTIHQRARRTRMARARFGSRLETGLDRLTNPGHCGNCPSLGPGLCHA